MQEILTLIPAGTLQSAELRPDIPASLFPVRPEKESEAPELGEKPNTSRPRSHDTPRIQVARHLADVDVFDDDFESEDFLAGRLFP